MAAQNQNQVANVSPPPQAEAMVDPKTGAVSPAWLWLMNQYTTQILAGQDADVLNLFSDPAPDPKLGVNDGLGAFGGPSLGWIAAQLRDLDTRLTLGRAAATRPAIDDAALLFANGGYRGEEAARIADLEARVALIAEGGPQSSSGFTQTVTTAAAPSVALSTSPTPLFSMPIPLSQPGTYRIDAVCGFLRASPADSYNEFACVCVIGGVGPLTPAIVWTEEATGANTEITLACNWIYTTTRATDTVNLQVNKTTYTTGASAANGWLTVTQIA